MSTFIGRTCLFAACMLVIAGSTHAARPCVDNYVESGEWSTGKQYSTWVEYSASDMATGFATLGRLIAADGWLGLSASKDLGVVSAYQEDNGKKSPLNATFTTPAEGRVRIDLSFQLARGLRAPSAAIRDGLCKLLEGAVPEEQRAEATGGEASGVSLRTASGDIPLVTTVGEFRKAGFGPVLLLFSDFRPSRAEIRTTDRRPRLLVRATDDPSAKYLLIRFEQKGDRRSIKLGSAGSVIRMGVTGGGELPPDEDWTLPFTASQEAPDLWLIQPQENLEPGEYGLWEINGYGAATFGTDPQ